VSGRPAPALTPPLLPRHPAAVDATRPARAIRAALAPASIAVLSVFVAAAILPVAGALIAAFAALYAVVAASDWPKGGGLRLVAVIAAAALAALAAGVAAHRAIAGAWW
jgi:hypothetical protein